MKTAIIILVVFAYSSCSAIPLRSSYYRGLPWTMGDYDDVYGTPTWLHRTPYYSSGLMGGSYYGMYPRMTSALPMETQRLHDLREETEQMDIRNTVDHIRGTIRQTENTPFYDYPLMGSGKTLMADKMAHVLTGKTLKAEQVQMNTAMNNIVRESDVLTGQPLVKYEIRKNLVKDILDRDRDIEVGATPILEMKDTFVAAIKAQMAMEGIDAELVFRNPEIVSFMKWRMADFKIQILKLIEENNVKETEASVAKFKAEIEQLDSQLKFLDKQLQLLETHKLLGLHGYGMNKLVWSEKDLFLQKEKLMAEKIALRMIVKQLEKMIISQEKQLTKGTIIEEMNEMNPMMMTPMVHSYSSYYPMSSVMMGV